MTDNVRHTSSRQIEAEAFAWVAQIDSGELSGADRAALNEWLKRSPAHEAEFSIATELSNELSIMTELLEPLHHQKQELKRQHPLFAHRLLAASCALLFAFFVYQLAAPPASDFSAFYATRIGDYCTEELPDGSTLKLNTNSAAEVTINKDERIIRLTKGEAFFDVAKDPDRPFVVYAGDNIAKAIGTSFSVRVRDHVTELIVVEGIVEFSQRIPQQRGNRSSRLEPVINPLPPVQVAAGFSILPEPVNTTGIARELTPIEQVSKLSWTEGLFDFSGLPLEDVISEVSRHTTLQIEIEDQNLKSQKFGGIFRVGDVETLLDTLSLSGIDVERPEDNRVILR